MTRAARRRRPSAAAWLGAAGLGAAALLRSSFTAKAGSARFYLLTTSLAGTWTCGALGAGPIPWRGERLARPPRKRGAGPYRRPVVTGAATFAVFYGAARVARRHRTLRRAIASVLRYAEAGSTPLVVLIASGSGVAEELFFRGALWSGPRPLRTTTLAYAASTAATGNPALVLAGLVTSVIFGWQRAATGGVLAPAVTHVTWSVLMLCYLPPLFRDADRPGTPAGRRRTRISRATISGSPPPGLVLLASLEPPWSRPGNSTRRLAGQDLGEGVEGGLEIGQALAAAEEEHVGGHPGQGADGPGRLGEQPSLIAQGRGQLAHGDGVGGGLLVLAVHAQARERTPAAGRGMSLKTGGARPNPYMLVISAAAVLPWASSWSNRLIQSVGQAASISSAGS